MSARDAAWVAAMDEVAKKYGLEEEPMEKWMQEKDLREWAQEEREDGTAELIGSYESLVAPDLLIIDEVAGESGSDVEKRVFFTVLNARYEAMRPVALITNASASRLKSYLGERAFSRVCETAGIVLFTWGSFRGETIRHKNWEEGK